MQFFFLVFFYLQWINSDEEKSLTADVESDGVALAVAFVIAGDAGVDAGPLALHIADDQRVIVYDDALVDVLMNLFALQWKRKLNWIH